jgi:hypothetical protein
MAYRLSPNRALLALALLLLAVPQARADFIPWTYQGQIVTTGNFNILGSHILISPGKLNDQVQFADVTGVGSGSMSVTGFQMRADTDFTAFHGFSKDIHTFNLGFGILDAASGKSGSVVFHGTVDGSMWTGSPDTGMGIVQLHVGFTGPTQQSLQLGNHLYKVSIAPFNFSNFSAPVPTVTAYQNVPISVQVVSTAAEPSTLALAAVGLAGLGARAWRRRKRAVEAAVGQARQVEGARASWGRSGQRAWEASCAGKSSHRGYSVTS